MPFSPHHQRVKIILVWARLRSGPFWHVCQRQSEACYKWIMTRNLHRISENSHSLTCNPCTTASLLNSELKLWSVFKHTSHLWERWVERAVNHVKSHIITFGNTNIRKSTWQKVYPSANKARLKWMLHQPMSGGLVDRVAVCYTEGPGFKLWHGGFGPADNLSKAMLAGGSPSISEWAYQSSKLISMISGGSRTIIHCVPVANTNGHWSRDNNARSASVTTVRMSSYRYSATPLPCQHESRSVHDTDVHRLHNQHPKREHVEKPSKKNTDAAFRFPQLCSVWCRVNNQRFFWRLHQQTIPNGFRHLTWRNIHSFFAATKELIFWAAQW